MKISKKILSFLFIAIFAVVLVACNNDTQSSTTDSTTQSTTESTTGSTTGSTTQTTTESSTSTTTESTTEVQTPLYETVTDVYIHLNREMAMVEDLEVKAFGKDLTDEYPTENDVFFDFSETDAYGIYAVIAFDELVVERSTLGFVIQTADGQAVHSQVESVDFANQDNAGVIHVYVDEINDVVAYEEIEDAELITLEIGYISHFQPQAPQLITRETFDDFTRSVIESTGVSFTGEVALSDRVKHLVVDYTDTLGITPDDAIYKAASGANTQGSYLYLALVMKGSNGASINDLKVAFRLDDNHELIIRDFTDLVDPDYQALPELSTDYQVYLIDIANSLDGLTFTGKTGHTDVAAGGSIVGFHLMADGVGSGKLEIEEVYYTGDAISTGYSDTFDFLIDDFQKATVATALTDVYWCGSVGYLVDKWLIMDASSAEATYQDESTPINDLENIEITLRSSVEGDIYVTPIFNDGSITLGTEVLLSTLLDDEGNALGNITTAFTTKRINLENNSWANTLTGLKFRLASNVVTIDKIEYLTITEGADPVYPEISAEDVVVFDDFERDEVGATTVYDANNPIALANDLYYIITYSDAVTKGQLYIENGAVVFDNTEDEGYINFVEASLNGNLGTHKYLVFRLKTDQGGSLDQFRIQTGTDAVTWANEFYAAPGMLSVDSPYLTNDGFMYMVVDLELSGLLTSFEELTLYYSDAGRLIIDSIFFANDSIKELDLDNKNEVDEFDGVEIITAGEDYAYNHLAITDANTQNQRYLVMVVKGTGFADFRFEAYDGEGSSPVKYITDLVGIDGYKYKLEDLSDTEYRYLIIDMEATGIKFHPTGIHLHLNNAKIYFESIFFADTLSEKEVDPVPLARDTLETPMEIDASASEYAYNYIGLDNAAYADYLILTVSGNIASLRFQFLNHDESITSDFYYLNNFIGLNGAPLLYELSSTEEQVLIIDLKASGITQNINAMHVHYGDATTEDIMTIHSITLNDDLLNQVEIDTNPLEAYEPTEALVIDATGAGYVYNYIGMDNPVTADYMEIIVSGNVESFRFAFINNDESVVSGVYFLSDLLGVDGNPLLFRKFTEDEQVLLIDLKASGITQNIQAFHVHYGDDQSADDIVNVHSIKFYDRVYNEIDLSSETEVFAPVTPVEIDATAAGYVYSYIGLDTALTSERYLAITVQGNISSLRIQGISVDEVFTSETIFLNNLIGIDGNPIQYIGDTSTPQTIIIDLYESGLGFDLAAMHVHYGDDDPTADDILSVISIKAYMQTNYLEAIDLAIGE